MIMAGLVHVYDTSFGRCEVHLTQEEIEAIPFLSLVDGIASGKYKPVPDQSNRHIFKRTEGIATDSCLCDMIMNLPVLAEHKSLGYIIIDYSNFFEYRDQIRNDSDFTSWESIVKSKI